MGVDVSHTEHIFMVGKLAPGVEIRLWIPTAMAVDGLEHVGIGKRQLVGCYTDYGTVLFMGGMNRVGFAQFSRS